VLVENGADLNMVKTKQDANILMVYVANAHEVDLNIV
jgi:hypothetical protein